MDIFLIENRKIYIFFNFNYLTILLFYKYNFYKHINFKYFS